MIDFRFYLTTDRTLCAPRSLQTVVREACDAGVRAVQLREKDLSAKDLREYASRLLEITGERGAKLLVNRFEAIEMSDEAFVAASIEVDGFHFPENVPFPHKMRKHFPKLLVGMSTHSKERALTMELEGADFVTFGPVFSTPTKESFGPPQGLDALAAVTKAVSIPVFAIGGVTPVNALWCMDRGAHGVAAVSAVMTSQDIPATMQAFTNALGSL